jgi:hypothetical protein
MKNFEVGEINFLWDSLGLCFVPDAKDFLRNLSRIAFSKKVVHYTLNFGYSVTIEGEAQREFLSIQVTITNTEPDISFEISFPFKDTWTLAQLFKIGRRASCSRRYDLEHVA